MTLGYEHTGDALARLSAGGGPVPLAVPREVELLRAGLAARLRDLHNTVAAAETFLGSVVAAPFAGPLAAVESAGQDAEDLLMALGQQRGRQEALIRELREQVAVGADAVRERDRLEAELAAARNELAVLREHVGPEDPAAVLARHREALLDELALLAAEFLRGHGGGLRADACARELLAHMRLADRVEAAADPTPPPPPLVP